MMQPHQIVKALTDLGVTIRADGADLVVAPNSKVTADLAEELRRHKAELVALLSYSNPCTCPWPNGAAGCGPGYPVCSACGYTWCCKDCGGCRRCASPGRKVRQPGDIDLLPFPLGNGGLDPIQVEMVECHNTRLGVVDPVERRLNVLWWLHQYYQESGGTDLAAEVKAAYYQLRDGNPDVVALVRIGELSEETLLKRLRNGQKWLGEYLHEVDGGAADREFGKALAAWSEMEAHLLQRHGYRGCIHGEAQRCPKDAVVSCDVCMKILAEAQKDL